VLGDETSSKYESFAENGQLEYPQYTRPREYRGMAVPDVLLTGNHQQIARWRDQASLERTREQRSDLLSADRSPADACPTPAPTGSQD
jgi:tRNA (guanine37-N1)-methyltransferase